MVTALTVFYTVVAVFLGIGVGLIGLVVCYTIFLIWVAITGIRLPKRAEEPKKPKEKVYMAEV